MRGRQGSEGEKRCGWKQIVEIVFTQEKMQPWAVSMDPEAAGENQGTILS